MGILALHSPNKAPALVGVKTCTDRIFLISISHIFCTEHSGFRNQKTNSQCETWCSECWTKNLNCSLLHKQNFQKPRQPKPGTLCRMMCLDLREEIQQHWHSLSSCDRVLHDKRIFFFPQKRFNLFSQNIDLFYILLKYIAFFFASGLFL